MSFFNWFSSEQTKREYIFKLQCAKGNIEYYNPMLNFLGYGGMGCGKTKSLGKPLLREYLRHHFAGFIYDFKDFDFARTAYNILRNGDFKDYPYSFHIVNFARPEYSERTNPISPNVIKDENLFIQLIDDMLRAYMHQSEGSNKESPFWTEGCLGIFQGVSYRFYIDYPQMCTIAHIVTFLTHSSIDRISSFLKGNERSAGLASAFLNCADAKETQSGLLTNLLAFLSKLSFNKNILYILSGDDFDFNLIDPKNPKLVCVGNCWQTDRAISPVVALMLGVSTRQFTMDNKVPFFYLLDEATTFKISNFQTLCSILREYKCSFTFLTQSSTKIDYMYSETERSIIESNFGNHFYGRTFDKGAISNYPILFGKKETERITTSKGGVGGKVNSSTSVTTQKEDVYDPKFFTELEPGRFVCSASEANKKKFVADFKMLDVPEPYDIQPNMTVAEIELLVEDNFQKIKQDISICI